MTEEIKQNVIDSALAIAKKFSPEQATSFLRGMAKVKPESPTSRKLEEIAAEYQKKVQNPAHKVRIRG